MEIAYIQAALGASPGTAETGWPLNTPEAGSRSGYKTLKAYFGEVDGAMDPTRQDVNGFGAAPVQVTPAGVVTLYDPEGGASENARSGLPSLLKSAMAIATGFVPAA